MRSDVRSFDLGQFVKKFLLSGIELLGDFELDVNPQIAASTTMRIGHALLFDLEDGIGLSACWDREFLATFQQGNFQFGTENGLRVSDRDMADEVDPFPLEEGVLLHLNVAIQIAGRASVKTGFSFAAQTELHPGIDPGGNVDFERDVGILAARASALLAFFPDDFPFAATGGAGGLNAEEALGLHHLSASAAVLARFGLSSGLGTGSLAGFAFDRAIDFQGAFATFGRFEEIDRDAGAKTFTSASRSAAPTAPSSSEDPSEDIAEGLEDIGDILESRAPSAAVAQPCVAVAVVAGFLFVVGEDFVGLGAFLEAFGGFFISGVAVRMKFHRLLAIRLLDLLGGRFPSDLQDFVIIAFGRHGLST